MAQALTSVQLLPSLPTPADHSPGRAGEAAGQQGCMAPCPAPMLGLSRQGLGNMVAAAAGALRAPAAERGAATALQLVRKSMHQAVGAPGGVAPAVPPAADECALCLALCAERVPAVVAAAKQLRGHADPASEVRHAPAVAAACRSLPPCVSR